jgi:NitT/TauT family transport system substrate-binding protein
MSTVAEKTIITIESAEAVLGLHWFVARDFTATAEGLDLKIITPGIKTRFDLNDPRAHDHHLVSSWNYQKAWEQGKCDVYRACEWGQIRRTYDSKRKGPIAGKRPAMVFQAVYVRPDSPLNTPIQLAQHSVGVQFHQGSHYSTLAMLEGFVKREDIKVVHAGMVQERYEALMEGTVEAATLMEPWITLAEKNKCKFLVGTFYQGLENISADVAPDKVAALTRAVKNAVKLIQNDPRRFVHYMIEEIPEKYARHITPSDFHLPRLRYVDPAPYTQEEFQRAYDWMLTWDLVGPNAKYENMVCNVY